MATTIQISNVTKQLLETLKEEENANSYDKIIQNLVNEHQEISKSMFGTIKGLRWNKNDRMKIKDV